LEIPSQRIDDQYTQLNYQLLAEVSAKVDLDFGIPISNRWSTSLFWTWRNEVKVVLQTISMKH